MSTVTVLGRPGLVRELLERIVHEARLHPPGAPVAVLVEPDPGDWQAARTAGARIVLLCRDALDPDGVAEAVLAGADAVVHTGAGPAEVTAAVEAVAGGATLLDPGEARALVDAARARMPDGAAHRRLTRREGTILRCIADGLSVKQTARALGIAEKTVENVQSRLFRKLDARNRAQAVTRAAELGILEARVP